LIESYKNKTEAANETESLLDYDDDCLNDLPYFLGNITKEEVEKILKEIKKVI
jgi:hypothetical protein